MTLPVISTVINPPLVSDTPEQFNTKAFDSWLKLSLLSPELNTWSIAADALGVSMSSNKSAVDLKAAEASASASNATGSASSANSSKIEAAQSASNALTSANNAESSAVQASKLNLGAKNTPPTLDNQGQPLLTGAVYYDTVSAKWKVWNGSTWVNGVTAGVTSVNGNTGDVILTSVASAAKLTTARTINGVSFDGTTNITVADSTKLPLTGGNISGSLGIGTSSPDAILHTHSTSGVAHVISASSVSPALEFRDSAATPNRWWIGSGALAPNDGALFVYDAKQAALRLTISPGGEMAALNSSGLGYGAGSGGNVTQAVNLTQAVEINKPTGTITMFSGLTAGQDVVFEVYNNKIANTDVVVLTPQTGSLQGYSFEADIPANGYFRIRAKNPTSTDLSIAPVIGFAIIKGVRV